VHPRSKSPGYAYGHVSFTVSYIHIILYCNVTTPTFSKLAPMNKLRAALR